MSKDVLFTIEDGIAYIQLNRPKYGNAIHLDLAQVFLKTVISCDQRKDIRCVVLTGDGDFFCTGGDVESFQKAGDTISEFLSELVGILHLAISRLLRMDKPLLVAVNGAAVGAGMGLSLIGDIVIASEKAQFYPAYMKLGLSPDAGLTWILPKLVGLRRAQEILIMNQKITAQQALDYGLVTSVCSSDNFSLEIKKYAHLLANSSLPAIKNVRQLLLMEQQNSIETHLEFEARAIADISSTETVRENILGFLKRH